MLSSLSNPPSLGLKSIARFLKKNFFFWSITYKFKFDGRRVRREDSRKDQDYLNVCLWWVFFFPLKKGSSDMEGAFEWINEKTRLSITAF